jgi:hypothetical protein
MRSERHSEASRINGAKSRDPKTPRGRAISPTTPSPKGIANALRAELPNEPILEAQPEEKEAIYAQPDEPISTPKTFIFQNETKDPFLKMMTA